jgi:cadmium resistance transport/sequestration family protein
MGWLLQVIIAGISAFAATNIDDIVILMFFFSQVNVSLRIRHIVIGQYLGFTILVIASLPGFFGGLIVPKTWIGLLGFVPIWLGISQLLKPDQDGAEVQTVSREFNKRSPMNILANFLNPQVSSVAAITFANGGDNIGIYVPFFASLNLPGLIVVLSVFLIMVGVWCYVAYLLSRQRLIGLIFTRYGRRIVPFVLIGLGIFILKDSQTYQLLPQLK